MRTNSSGYNDSMYDHVKHKECVQSVAEAIPYYLNEFQADAIVVTGKSGVAVAFSALMLVNFPLVVVRKDGENSHGNKIEGPNGLEVKRYIILDDFVDSGATIKRVVRSLSMLDRPPELVGVLEYTERRQGCAESLTVQMHPPVYVPKIGIARFDANATESYYDV